MISTRFEKHTLDFDDIEVNALKQTLKQWITEHKKKQDDSKDETVKNLLASSIKERQRILEKFEKLKDVQS